MAENVPEETVYLNPNMSDWCGFSGKRHLRSTSTVSGGRKLVDNIAVSAIGKAGGECGLPLRIFIINGYEADAS